MAPIRQNPGHYWHLACGTIGEGYRLVGLRRVVEWQITNCLPAFGSVRVERMGLALGTTWADGRVT